MSLLPAQGIPTGWKRHGRVTQGSGAMLLFSSAVNPEQCHQSREKSQGQLPANSRNAALEVPQPPPSEEGTESSSCQPVDIPSP